MRFFARGIFGVAAVGVLLGWSGGARGAVVAQDRFDATLNFLPAVQTPVTDVHFFRGFTSAAGGGGTGESAGVADIGTANGGGGFTVLLPAVQSPPNEEYGVVGLCDGSVMVALNFDVAKNFIGNAGFNFQSTFGISEPDLIAALQADDVTALTSFFVNAYGSGLLPAVQRGAASGGELVGFSTPVDFGSISVVENAPEPGTVGIGAAMAVLVLRRRR